MDKQSFRWKALDQDGRILRGEWELQSTVEVRQQLFQLGYFPIQIQPRRNRLRFVGSFLYGLNQQSDWRRIWADLTQRLALLLQAGIPLLTAVQILAEADKRVRRRSLGWELVKEQLAAGNECSTALSFLTPTPTPLTLALIAAGEQTGKLAEAMLQISSDLEEELKFRRKLAGAYTYPLVLLALSFGVIYALNVMVLPVYEQIFNSFNAGLPPLTLLVFRIFRYFPFILFIIALLALGFIVQLRVRYADIWQEKLIDCLIVLPFLGTMYRLNDSSRWTYVLATLLEAGVPLVEALKMTAPTVKSYESRKLIESLGTAVREGKGLAAVLRQSQFPLEATLMLSLGEESGKLTEMLHSTARILRAELEKKMELLPKVIGPVTILLISGVIGLVAAGVLLPIFEVGTHLE